MDKYLVFIIGNEATIRIGGYGMQATASPRHSDVHDRAAQHKQQDHHKKFDSAAVHA